VNFVIWALTKLRKREEIKAVTDQYSSPTFADALAETLLCMASSTNHGIYHTAGKSCVNRYDFTLEIAKTFGFSNALIKPATSDVFKQVAERPKQCCLSVSKAEQTFGKKSLSVEEGLTLMKFQSKEAGW
jgi:dTDP-4-dehydrorhamnose reductase